MSTLISITYERDEDSGREVHIYRDLEEPGLVFLDATGFAFEIEGPIHVSTEYPFSISICLPVQQARKLGLPEDRFEVTGKSAAHITVKFPEEWARKLGLLKDTSVERQ